MDVVVPTDCVAVSCPDILYIYTYNIHMHIITVTTCYWYKVYVENVKSLIVLYNTSEYYIYL